MIITGSYEMERTRAFRNHPDYDYYGNYIGDASIDETIIKQSKVKKTEITLKEAA